MTLTVKTFAKRSRPFREIAEDFKREVLKGMVDTAVDASPVDTAAYVDSFGFNGPQGFSSKERPRTRPGPSTDVGAAKDKNKTRLRAEVDSLNLSGPVVFGNAAPHANIVENGSQYQSGEQVFGRTRREFTRLTREALQKSRGAQ